MSDIYTPPFAMTEEITNLVIEIGEQVGVVAVFDTLQPNPRLRRENRIKSIHSSLAIEQNTLTIMNLNLYTRSRMATGASADCGSR